MIKGKEAKRTTKRLAVYVRKTEAREARYGATCCDLVQVVIYLSVLLFFFLPSNRFSNSYSVVQLTRDPGAGSSHRS